MSTRPSRRRLPARAAKEGSTFALITASLDGIGHGAGV
jgi:hypothetical protein